MSIRSFIRGIREEILPETVESKLDELEELERRMSNFKVSKDTVIFKKQADVDFYKAVLKYCDSREAKEGSNE